MGGAAGHMAHPFDLPWVNSGADLLDFFDRAKTFVESKGAGAVKIDGVNVSFKVVGDDDVKQFAVDRGSLKPIDIEGITAKRVNDRFPEGHGMRPAITTLLAILNAAIDEIKPELQELGMWDDPSRFLNTEYVEGTTNVTQYDDNFLAIHGLNQFYHRIGKSGAAKGNERPGMQRPDGEKAASVEVPYEPATMESLVEKLRSIAEKYGFKVFSSVPTERIGEIDIDFSQALSEPITVRVSDDREITKSLGEWLQEATNPRYKTVKLKDGKRTHPLHKQLYMNIINNSTPIVDLIEDTDAEAAIYGAIFMHATRMLGNEVLRGLTSPMGDVMSHEGVVLRDEKLFGPNPVKITGEFIVGNMGGGFGQVNEQEGEEEEEAIELDIVDVAAADVVPSAAPNSKIAVVPGAFKPPHRGHLAMIEEYAANNDMVKVLISNPLKRQRSLADGTVITSRHALNMWVALTGHLDNVEIEISDAASPMTAAYEFVGEEGPLGPGDVLTLGASTKGNDWKRWLGAEKYIKDGVDFQNPHTTAVAPSMHSPDWIQLMEDSPLFEELPSQIDSERDHRYFHASDMRYLLGKAKDDAEAVELLEDFVGGEGDAMEFLSILGIDSGLNEPIEETSAMGGVGGGDVSGGGEEEPGKRDDPLVGRWRSTAAKRKRKKKKTKTENIDMSLVMEVYELLIGRGIKL
jgi:hypothetical protein